MRVESWGRARTAAEGSARNLQGPPMAESLARFNPWQHPWGRSQTSARICPRPYKGRKQLAGGVNPRTQAATKSSSPKGA